MRTSVRFSIVAISVIVALFTIQIGVSAQKKRSKRKHRTARIHPMIVAPPVFSSALSPPLTDDGSSIVNNASPSVSSPAAPLPSKGGFRIESSGDTSTSGKRTKGRVSTEPVPNSVAAGTLLISEFKLQGAAGVNDEFIEIYNNSGADHLVTAFVGTAYAVAASDGAIRCTIPNGTVIPAAGHFLCVNSAGYTLSTYASGNGTTATGDASYVTDIPLNAGIALFNNNLGGANFTLANQFDAVGSTTEANALYKEGTGYPAMLAMNASTDHSWLRDECGKSGNVNQLGKCTISTPKDTDDNNSDFFYFDTNGTPAGAGQRLGAPGPQNLSSPLQRNSTIPAFLLDATVAAAGAPNRVRDLTPDGPHNSTHGTLSIRRRFVNNTGANVNRLRFRVIDLDTFPAASGFADLRVRTSSTVVVPGINDSVTCTAAGQPTPCSVSVGGTDVEGGDIAEVPAQPNGGAFNSSLSVGTVTLLTPLPNGASIDVQFLLGVQQAGNFRIYVNIEALP